MTVFKPTLKSATLLATLSLLMLTACQKAEPNLAAVPTEIDPQTTCSLDGMQLADYPGPKAQILYAGEAKPTYFCDTVELFHALLRPEQVKTVQAVFVQDMGQADWDNPRGHWIDAKTAWYVHGSSRKGSMGPTIAAFATQADADKFVAAYGGKVLKFAEVKPEMADLSGGALHDSKM